LRQGKRTLCILAQVQLKAGLFTLVHSVTAQSCGVKAIP
jgi:hypothetical protein